MHNEKEELLKRIEKLNEEKQKILQKQLNQNNK